MGPFALGQVLSWNNWTPKKVNICVWRAVIDRLPTLSKLAALGIALSSQACPLCESTQETIEHLVNSCPMLRSLWLKCWGWWGALPPPRFSVKDAISGSLAVGGDKGVGKDLQGVFYVLLWSIWKCRNKIVHAVPSLKPTIRQEDVFPQV